MHSTELDIESLMQNVLPIVAVANEMGKKYRKMVMNHQDIGSKIKISDDLKVNNSPVTQADIEIENYLKHELCKLLPGSHFEGEETGFSGSDSKSDYTRRCDPIDKTRQMGRGQHNRGILIALKKNDKIILGLSSMPAIGEILYAYTGGGARLNGKKTQVSSIDFASQPMITHERTKYFEAMGNDVCKGLSALGNDAYCTIDTLMTYHYLASGRGEGHITPPTYLYDIAPFLIIITEAGGRITQMNGDPLLLSPGEKTTAIFSNGVCHDELVSYFQ